MFYGRLALASHTWIFAWNWVNTFMLNFVVYLCNLKRLKK